MARSMKILWHCWSPEQLVTHFSKHSFLNCYLKFQGEDFAESVTLEWRWWDLVCLLEQDVVAEHVKNMNFYSSLQAFSASPQTLKHVWPSEPQSVSCGRSERRDFWQIWCLLCLFLFPSPCPAGVLLQGVCDVSQQCFWDLPVIPVPGCWLCLGAACWNTLIWETSPVGCLFSATSLVFPFLLKPDLLCKSMQKICILAMFFNICLKLASPVTVLANKLWSINRETEVLLCGVLRNFFSIWV